MAALKPSLPILSFFLLLSLYSNTFIHTALADGVTPEEAKQLRDEVIPIQFSQLSFPIIL